MRASSKKQQEKSELRLVLGHAKRPSISPGPMMLGGGFLSSSRRFGGFDRSATLGLRRAGYCVMRHQRRSLRSKTT